MPEQLSKVGRLIVRPAAAPLALRGMTAVIEIFVYPDLVIARGAGIFSLDDLLLRRWSRVENPR
jgi:hypothetical protein